MFDRAYCIVPSKGRRVIARALLGRRESGCGMPILREFQLPKCVWEEGTIDGNPSAAESVGRRSRWKPALARMVQSPEILLVGARALQRLKGHWVGVRSAGS